MLLERLNDHCYDLLCCGRINVRSDSDHYYLDQATENELNVHDFCDALVRILDCHLKLSQDHHEHGLETGITLEATGLA